MTTPAHTPIHADFAPGTDFQADEINGQRARDSHS
jgi:hypothetical protein